MSVLSVSADSPPWVAPASAFSLSSPSSPAASLSLSPLDAHPSSSSSSPSSYSSESFSFPLSFVHTHLLSLIAPPPPPTSSSSPPSPSSHLSHPVTSVHFAQQLIAGGLAGSVARTVVAPFDRVKMLMQTQFLLHQAAQSSASLPRPSLPPSPPPPPPPAAAPAVALRTLGVAFPTALLPSLRGTGVLPADKYQAVVQSLRVIVAEEGVAKLWKGNLLNISRVFPYSAIQFSSYDAYKHWIRGGSEQRGKLNARERLVAGALAGMTATSLTHPMDVVRLRLSIHKELTGVVDAFQHVWAEGGARALFKGFIPTMLSVSPFIAINFASFDLLKQRVADHSTANILLLGAASGLLAQSVCYPLDTVRRRQQMRGKHYDGMLDAFQRILKVEGVRGLYRGMVPNAVKVVPNNAIRFVVFEAVKKHMGIGQAHGGGGGGM